MSSLSKPPQDPVATTGRHGGDKALKVPAAKVMIVGIGASAGGLEAFKTFFSQMPADRLRR
jgi:two-component system CheB/CheR fusion protein